MDTKPGDLDTWPAHAEGPEPPSLGPEQSQKHTEFMPKGNYKPKFLGQLESFLKKELRVLGCTESKPSEKRLQVEHGVILHAQQPIGSGVILNLFYNWLF